jgi:hypothetical protein
MHFERSRARIHTVIGHVLMSYLAMESPARSARPGLKFLGLDQLEHACGPGLYRKFRLDGCAGPSLGLRNVSEEARPEARSPMSIYCGGPDLGQNCRPDGRAGPGLGLVFFASGFVRPGPNLI